VTYDVTFVVEKETKGSFRYKEVNEDGTEKFNLVAQSIYIRKSALTDNKVPQKIRCKLEW